MTFFGLSDPYIIGAYVGCILCVILCCAWAIFKKDDGDEEEGEE
jgi:hypothetical protein